MVIQQSRDAVDVKRKIKAKMSINIKAKSKQR